MAVGWSWAGLMTATLCMQVSSKHYACPTYEELVEDSIAPGRFDMNMVAGAEWFMAATTEPTLPSFCHCTVSTYSVHEHPTTPGGWYNYTANSTCSLAGVTIPFAVPLMGMLSENASTPGWLKETFRLWNHTVGPRDPNYVFRAEYSRGKVRSFHTYACLGSVFGKPLFSYSYLVRKDDEIMSKLDEPSILAQVKAANAKGLMDLDHVRATPLPSWQQCGLLADSILI